MIQSEHWLLEGMSISALGGHRASEGGIPGTTGLESRAQSKWPDPSEEAEDRDARSWAPAAGRWVTLLPAGENPEVSAGWRPI